MKTGFLRSKVGGVLLGFAILFGIGIASSATAQAQYPYPNDRDGQYRRDRRDDRYDRNGGYNNGSRAAMNQGYQDGTYTGSNDAQRRQSYNPYRSHYYKNNNSSAYREGFLRGYQEGYRQYGGNRGGYGYPNRTGSVLGGIFGRP